MKSKTLVIVAGGFLVILLLITVVISQFGRGSSDEATDEEEARVSNSEESGQPFTGTGQGAGRGQTDKNLTDDTDSAERGGAGSDAGQGSAGVRSADDVVAIVGEEQIYYVDVQYVISKYPDSDDADEKEILERLVEESIILQAADADGLVKVSPSFYDNVNKDYLLRQRAINTVKEKIDARSSVIKGKVVSIWFANDVEPEMGVEEAQKIAKQKIEALHSSVVSGQMTIEEAGENVRNDDSLEALDVAHDVNALLKFDRQQGEGITISEELDEALWEADEGDVTDVFLVQAIPTFIGEEADALYMFGQVQEKKVNPRYPSYNDWLKTAKQEYDITYN